VVGEGILAEAGSPTAVDRETVHGIAVDKEMVSAREPRHGDNRVIEEEVTDS